MKIIAASFPTCGIAFREALPSGDLCHRWHASGSHVFEPAFSAREGLEHRIATEIALFRQILLTFRELRGHAKPTGFMAQIERTWTRAGGIYGAFSRSEAKQEGFNRDRRLGELAVEIARLAALEVLALRQRWAALFVAEPSPNWDAGC